MSSKANLRSNVACQTVSNALLKYNAKTTTNGLLESKSMTECRKAIRAAVVEPVGLKAYWSVKVSGVGGVIAESKGD